MGLLRVSLVDSIPKTFTFLILVPEGILSLSANPNGLEKPLKNQLSIRSPKNGWASSRAWNVQHRHPWRHSSYPQTTRDYTEADWNLQPRREWPRHEHLLTGADVLLDTKSVVSTKDWETEGRGRIGEMARFAISPKDIGMIGQMLRLREFRI